MTVKAAVYTSAFTGAHEGRGLPDPSCGTIWIKGVCWQNLNGPLAFLETQNEMIPGMPGSNEINPKNDQAHFVRVKMPAMMRHEIGCNTME